MPDISIIFHSRQEVLNMTDDQAREVIHAAANNMINQLSPFDFDGKQTYPFDWSDDGVDYLDAATDHWTNLWQMWIDQFNEVDGLAAVKPKLALYLLEAQEGATDGEFRRGIFSEELLKELWGEDYA